MNYAPARPTSNALSTLRFGATLSCWVFGVALVVQVLMWACVNFTELRHANIEDLAAASRPAVVQSTPPPQPTAATPAPATTPNGTTNGGENMRPTPVRDPADVPVKTADANRGVTRYEVYFRLGHELARAAGMMALFVLFIQLTLGVVVAAQTKSVGIGHVVGAHSWLLVIVSLAVPWQAFVPEFPYGGLFSEYATMVAQSERRLANDTHAIPTLVFYGSYLILPLASLAGIALVGLKFRNGVEGLIISGPSQFEIQLEEEASNRKAGTLVGAGRNAAALRSTMSSEEDSLPFLKSKPVNDEVATTTATRPATTPPLRRPI